MKLKKTMIYLIIFAIIVITYLIFRKEINIFFDQKITEITVGELLLVVYIGSSMATLIFKD